ncbi:MAG: VPLPA-CTERM sorting domain-containing protein [Gemmobacter sp.]
MRNAPFLSALAATALALPLTAHAAVLTFEGAICAGDLVCGNGGSINQTYGDISGVDVVYDGDPVGLGLQNFAYWFDDYSDLTDIAYYGAGATLSFLASAGFDVELTSLDLGAWPNTDRDLGFSVTDLQSNTEIVNTGLVTVSGTTSSNFLINLSSSVGLQITFFGDFFNGGVDNVVYSAVPTSAIPLPASGFFLLGGLAGLVGLRRRRRV